MKQQIIKFEQNLCNAGVDDNSILFVRVNGIVTDKKAIIEVPFTHNAILIKGGGDLRFLESGNYNVFDSKSQVKDWKKGLSVEVIYIPKKTRVLIKWGTPNRVQYRDRVSGQVVSVGAHGEFDLTVSDPMLFFTDVVGAKKEFNLQEFSKEFAELVASKFAKLFCEVVERMSLRYDEYDANKDDIAIQMCSLLQPIFETEYGLSVRMFRIAKIDISEADKQAIESVAQNAAREQKVKEYLAELERLQDKEWEREKYLRRLELQDNAAYYEVLRVMDSGAKTEAKTKQCPHCKNTIQAGAPYCHHCGKRVTTEPIVCQNCGKVNDYSAVYCCGCGGRLSYGDSIKG